MNSYEIVEFIKNAEKKTPVKAYIKGSILGADTTKCRVFEFDCASIIFGELAEVEQIIKNCMETIEFYELENNCRNSAVPMLDITHIEARIEPGAIIRDKVIIGKNAVVMMGAVINIGAEIGENTMIDMNAVVGARGIIGCNVHVGAGAVIAGVLEPPSKLPVIIEDDVMIGANAVILEGVRIGKGAVVAAGAVVTKDVQRNTVVAGMPAQVMKNKDEQTSEKVQIVEALR